MKETGGKMENYSVFSDFEHYVRENEEIITFLEQEQSLLNDYVAPIVRALNYIKKLKETEDEEFTQDDEDIFKYGFDYLFENIEQIKLYIHQLENDYYLLEKRSYYVKMVFQLEELKVELEKMERSDEITENLQLIDKLLEYFETYITKEDILIDETEMNQNISQFYHLFDQYNEIVLLTDAFNAYCATYGI